MFIATAYARQRCAGAAIIARRPDAPGRRISPGGALCRWRRRHAVARLRARSSSAGTERDGLGNGYRVVLLMIRRSTASLIVIVALCCVAPGGVAPDPALAASSRDAAAAHTVLEAGYQALRSVLRTWPRVEVSLRSLNLRFARECPNVGAGSPQTEAEKRLSYEVAGALWATAYHADAAIVHRFVHRVTGVRSSNPRLNRRVHRFLGGLGEMLALQVPDICADVRAWTASGYRRIPSSTLQYDKHVEAIDVEIPSPKLAEPYIVPADRVLLHKLERLITRFEEREFTAGQRWWDTLLETLGVPQ
jgi:hypothetical protein